MIFQTIHLNTVFDEMIGDGQDPVLRAYLPDLLEDRAGQKRPCLLICPGGGYGMCCQREAEPVALNFLPEGFNVFILDYSVAPHRFPTQLRQVAAALEVIHDCAEQWHCDVGRVAIMGFSAGGHLAAHYSTCYDCSEVRSAFPDSKPVQASILCYPVISADPAVAHLGSFENLLGHSPLTPEETKRFSCHLRVTPHTPPAFLWHTATDDLVPVMNSLLYAQALAANKVPFALHIYPAGWHGMSTVDKQTNDALDAASAHAVDWMDAAKKWLRIVFA